MKYIFLTLALINTAYFLSQLAVSGVPHSFSSGASAVSDGRVKSLALYGENIPSTPVAERKDPRCMLAGPFEDLLYAEYFEEALRANQVDARVRTFSAKAPLTELLVRVVDSKQTADRVLAQLLDHGIAAYVSDLGLSIGRYAGEGQIVERELLAQQAGFAVDRKIVGGGEMLHWVEFGAASAVKIRELIAKSSALKNNYIEIRQNVCLGVANN